MLSEEIDAILMYLRKQTSVVAYGVISVRIDKSFCTNIDESLGELERLNLLDKRKNGKRGFYYLLKPVIKQELLFIPFEFINNPYAYLINKERTKKKLELDSLELNVIKKKLSKVKIKEKVTEIQ